MSTLYGTRKYAIEGDNAAKVYDAVVNSFIYRNYPDTLTLEYKEGLLMIVEEWSNYPIFGDYVLPFLIGEDFTGWTIGPKMTLGLPMMNQASISA